MRLVYVYIFFALVSCTSKVDPYTSYLNHNDTVAYVGKESCMACHYDIYQTYIHTGMGQSMSLATPSNSEAIFTDKSILKDTFHNFHYQPYWKDSVLKLKELHDFGERIEDVDFIVGSGHHTNSHLWEENGYVHQMPFTYYTQDGHLDFPPGFEGGYNSRFSRKIGLECMSCHNAMPDFVLGSENKYNSIPQGIDCERCHGPGELHVQRMMNGEIVDTSQHIDYSIVNPKKLSLEAQFQICMRCHLQGNTVLEEGKSFLDFKPGMELSDVMTVFVPRYKDDNTFIMASHVDRFKQSACFTNSEMNCITCHNPHHSVKKESPNFFNDKCLSCHDDCKDEFRENNNCVECHMPSSSTIDIPHVSIHDHKIGIHNLKDTLHAKGEFIGLEAVNNSNPSKITRAKAYLYQYEKFDSQPYLLDSALSLLNSISLEKSFKERIHLYYLKEDDISILNICNSLDDLSLDKKSYDNSDAWTAYRIAQSYQNQGLSKQSLSFYQISVDLSPYVLDFRLKLADMYSSLLLYPEAEKEYRTLLAQFSKHENAWCNLGYVLLQQGQQQAALDCYNNALDLNPQHIQSLLNKASLMILKGEISKGMLYLKRILDIDPDNAKVEYLLCTL